MNHLAQMNAERMKDLQREAQNERLARNSQNQEEKRNLLQNALNVLKLMNSAENRR